jgi:hypothetical protein
MTTDDSGLVNCHIDGWWAVYEKDDFGSLHEPTESDDLDGDYMVETWASWLRATYDFERGYYQGRFEEYASQNAISPEEFPELRALAKQRVEEGP